MKYVYAFDEGRGDMKKLLGGKGANLAEMKRIGLPVPEGFTITTDACNMYYEQNENMGDELISQIKSSLSELENRTGKKLGGKDSPLLVSVRSGAYVSMPGMMDTVLNLGMNDETVKVIAKLSDDERFAMDSYRRFIQMFSDVVLGIEKYNFDNVFDDVKESKGVTQDTELSAEDLKAIIEKYKLIVFEHIQEPFPQDPQKQLLMAVEAVFSSWNNPRAKIYRQANDIAHDLGTAVNIQEMVFGNMGEDSGTGVAFTRNPSTGEKALFGEFLMNAQGEDVVAGIRTPQPVSALEKQNKKVYDEFLSTVNALEKHYKDMQDIEFTIEQGKLFFLQTRTAKRTAASAIRVAVDMVDEGLITKEEAIMRIDPSIIDKLLHPTFDPNALAKAHCITKGLPASPGAASGKVYFYSEDVVRAKNNGEKTILVRMETSPEDIEGMISSEGILTARGGMTSHAAVVARGMGKCCVAGCHDVKVSESEKIFYVGNMLFKEGDEISLDGNTGEVYKGIIPATKVEFSGHFGRLMKWADEIRAMKVRTNADTPKDAKTAVKFGAEGIGLCRTEHMFFEEDRIPIVREMILAKNIEQRQNALDKLLPIQKKDFYDMYLEMGNRPMTVRLLDPPLHEFLPHEAKDIELLASELNMEVKVLEEHIAALEEHNPMLGHRGCRLGITYPEIYQMQCKAIVEAAIDVKEKNGSEIELEIMIPLVGNKKELEILRKLAIKTLEDVFEQGQQILKYKIGTMIEVPRAALTADEIAQSADFFSFGTNDLTQMTLGFSRDDAGKFLPIYKSREIYEKDPFQSLDQTGVGELIKIATKKARNTKSDLKIGICGEHGGDPQSIQFFAKVGFDYISCSPYRVPIARIAAAQAEILSKK